MDFDFDPRYSNDRAVESLPISSSGPKRSGKIDLHMNTSYGTTNAMTVPWSLKEVILAVLVGVLFVIALAGGIFILINKKPTVQADQTEQTQTIKPTETSSTVMVK